MKLNISLMEVPQLLKDTLIYLVAYQSYVYNVETRVNEDLDELIIKIKEALEEDDLL